MATKPMTPRRAVPAASLLSHSTILILSGFLFGMASGHVVRPDIELCVYLAGAVGLVSYFALGLTAQRRMHKAARAEVQQATNRLEMRMDRHIPARTPLNGGRTPSADGLWSLAEIERQYLDVVNSRRSNFRKKSSPA